MAGKYTPLENYLRRLPANQREVPLSFEQIEKILNAKLPASAYEDDRWREHETEGNHVRTRAWANTLSGTRAGWKVHTVNVNERRVRFIKL